MKADYRGYEIVVTRAYSLGGSLNCYFSVFRKEDGLTVIDSFTSGEDPVSDMVEAMKRRVDEFIESRGASECLEDEYDVAVA